MPVWRLPCTLVVLVCVWIGMHSQARADSGGVAVWYVDSVKGYDVAGCGADRLAAACNSLQYAYNYGASSHTGSPARIEAAAGVYNSCTVHEVPAGVMKHRLEIVGVTGTAAQDESRVLCEPTEGAGGHNNKYNASEAYCGMTVLNTTQEVLVKGFSFRGCACGVLVDKAADVTVAQSVFQGGRDSSPHDSGSGALVLRGAGVRLDSVTVIGNQYVGPAVLADTCANLTIHNSLFADNINTGTAGGAVGIQGALAPGGDPDAQVTFMMEGCVFRNNTCKSGNQGSGGAVDVQASDATTVLLRDCVLTDNTAAHNGGAVRVVQGTLVLESSSFIDNSCSYLGGGLSVSQEGVVQASGTTFANNAGLSGGAVALFDSSVLAQQSSLTDCTFDANSGYERGGALYLGSDGSYSAVQMLIVRGSFSGHKGSPDGGVVYLSDAAVLRAVETVFRGNYAAAGGGVVWGAGDSLVDLTNVTCSNNSALRGGGVVYLQDFAVLEVTGGLYADNSSPQGKGGVVFMTQSSKILSDGVMFQGNTASLGGALYSDINAKMTIKQSTFEKNVARSSVQCRGGDGYGGAIFINHFTCKSVEAQHDVQFVQNAGQTAGGALFFGVRDGEQLPDCVTSAFQDSVFFYNTAPYGSSMSSNDVRFQITEQFMPPITPGVPFSLSFKLFDYFENQLSGFHESITLSIAHVNGHRLGFVGERAVSVVEGSANFTGLMVTMYTDSYSEDMVLDLTIKGTYPVSRQHTSLTLQAVNCPQGDTVAMFTFDDGTKQKGAFVCEPAVFLSGLRAGLFVSFLALVVCGMIFSLFHTVVRSHSRFVFAAGTAYLRLVLTGLAVLAVGVGVLVVKQNVVLCYVQEVCLSTGVAMLLAAVLAKLRYYYVLLPYDQEMQKGRPRARIQSIQHAASDVWGIPSGAYAHDLATANDGSVSSVQSYHSHGGGNPKLSKQPTFLTVLRRTHVQAGHIVGGVLLLDVCVLVTSFAVNPFEIRDFYQPVCSRHFEDARATAFSAVLIYYKLVLLCAALWMALRVRKMQSIASDIPILLSHVVIVLSVLVTLVAIYLTDTRSSFGHKYDVSTVYVFFVGGMAVVLGSWAMLVAPSIFSRTSSKTPFVETPARNRREALERLFQQKLEAEQLDSDVASTLHYRLWQTHQLDESGALGQGSGLEIKAHSSASPSNFAQEQEIYGTGVDVVDTLTVNVHTGQEQVERKTFQRDFSEGEIVREMLLYAGEKLEDDLFNLYEVSSSLVAEKKLLADSLNELAKLKWERWKHLKSIGQGAGGSSKQKRLKQRPGKRSRGAE